MFGNDVGRLRHVGREHFLRRGSSKRRAACQQFVGQHPHRIDVRTMIDVWISHRLLGCHIRRCPQRYASRGQLLPPRRLAHGLGDTEVRHQRVAAGQHHVVRFDVPVHHTVLVRVGQRIHHIPEEPHGFRHR